MRESRIPVKMSLSVKGVRTIVVILILSWKGMAVNCNELYCKMTAAGTSLEDAKCTAEESVSKDHRQESVKAREKGLQMGTSQVWTPNATLGNLCGRITGRRGKKPEKRADRQLPKC